MEGKVIRSSPLDLWEKKIYSLNMKDLDQILNSDAREIGKKFNRAFVDTTITSPPYFDLKDYGHKDQIGFGQDYDTYLNDLESVFRQTYKITKKSGSLWVIIDTFKKDGTVYPLPFDFANKIKDAGWKLQDILIWNKDRTVPWAHKGQMRNLFEYILVFSKTKDFKYRIDRVRDFSDLKRWWVKYPERYNPNGKNPAGIWKFDIPTQGSWGSGYVDHFCPLPEAMVQRIIKLTTDEGDVVFDPFAGSGTVPAQAAFMKRHYSGFELNKDYLKLFDKYLKENLTAKREEYISSRSNADQNKFKKLILELRSLKYASVILKKNFQDKKVARIEQIYAEKVGISKKKNKMIIVKYDIRTNNKSDIPRLKKWVEELSLIQPLSKFGIEPNFTFSTKFGVTGKTFANRVFCYQANSPHKFKERAGKGVDVASYPLISPISLALDEKDYY